MTSLNKILLLAASLLFAILIIDIAGDVFRPGADAARSAQSDFTRTASEIKDQKYMIFDQSEIDGSGVVNALRRFEKDGLDGSIALNVKTGKNGAAGVWYFSEFAADNVVTNNKNISNVKNSTNSEYINPTGLFNSNIERDSNGVIRAIKFVQK